ncbi:Carbon monoxide dehydrogenase accessory protein CooC [Pseudodesulfovibrio piezophilus C1TLV30]|uniref:Carbon monoxide dehydrogenase accessory protein CooC n=2 Tax=Pseudodesulfovibrio TaxID=2035811 RepID=M1WKV4_PSEP2|nr:Carbon monoxide dehydrogenase accessory protein CooC [Pseudodesulfovibrio piezophilus C1TLV30]
MKIAITGKGGVGKTTLAGLLARLLAETGSPVLAIDADPDANLGSALGVPEEALQTVTPISHMKELAEERTGAEGSGGFFSLNPRVADIPETFAVDHAGVRLLLLGTIEQGGGGCICPEHALVKTLMKHVLFQKNESVVMDMEAGVEHLGRGTAESVDALIIVVEPGTRSLQTANQIRRLGSDIGLKNIFTVGSKVRNEQEATFLTDRIPESELLGIMPMDDTVRQADIDGTAPFENGGEIVEAARRILARLYAGKAL